MQAVIYTRVSQDRTAGGRSVGEQEAECRALCQREDWTVAKVFTDNDRSASRYSRKARPAFDSLKDYIEHHDVDVLVTWEASRSTRDLASYVQLRDLCRERGVRWSYSGRTYDLSDAADQFGTGLDALLAEQESARTRERVSRSMRANATAGRPHGKASFGYRRVYDPATKQLLSVEVDEVEGPLLREAAQRVLEGESLASVVRDFAERGVTRRNGALLTTHGLRHCFVNPAFVGKRVHQGQVVGDAIWPAVFDETTWWRLQALLNDPARNLARNRRDIKHLLSGIATCGVCGGRVFMLRNRSSMSYTCRAAAHVSRKGVHVDELVVDVLLAGLSRPEQRGVFTEELGTAESPWAAIDAKRARLDAWYDAAASGEVTPAALARIEKGMLAEIAWDEVAARRSALPPELRALGDLDVPAEWDNLPIRTQRALMRHYLEVKILPTGKGRRKFDPASVEISWR